MLTELVEHLNTITVNDSLMVIGKMDEEEREDYLYRLAVDLVEAEDKAKQKGQDLSAMKEDASASGDKNAWYFYSDKARQPHALGKNCQRSTSCGGL